MKKRLRILLAALLVVVVGGLVCTLFPSGPPDPIYNGMPLSYWLTGHRGGPESVDAKTVPFLIKALERQDGPLKRTYEKLWPRLPLRLRSHLPEPVDSAILRMNAAFSLGKAGNDAKPAIPALLRALRRNEDAPIRTDVVVALAKVYVAGNSGKMGADYGKIDGIYQQVEDALLEATQDKDPGVRSLVVRDLQWMESYSGSKRLRQRMREIKTE